MIRHSNVIRLLDGDIELPIADNTTEALQIYRAANERFRQVAWPKPFDRTTHQVMLGDSRDLSAIPSKTVHLVARRHHTDPEEISLIAEAARRDRRLRGFP